MTERQLTYCTYLHTYMLLQFVLKQSLNYIIDSKHVFVFSVLSLPKETVTDCQRHHRYNRWLDSFKYTEMCIISNMAS